MTQETSLIADKFALLCPTCKKPVIEHHIDDIQTTWYICQDGHQTAVPIPQSIAIETKNGLPKSTDKESKDSPIILQHINEIENPKYIGKPITIQAVISSTSTAYSVPSR
jgi:hypothetical protein